MIFHSIVFEVCFVFAVTLTAREGEVDIKRDETYEFQVRANEQNFDDARRPVVRTDEKKVSTHKQNSTVDNKMVTRGDQRRLTSDDGLITATPPLPDCPYQYPGERQIETILSNMMNQLTRAFMDVNDMMEEKRIPNQRHRFKITSEKHKQFFDEVYANMTKEFRNYINVTINNVDKKRDPCRNQEEIKQMWRSLLNVSATGVGAAVYRCAEGAVDGTMGMARQRAHERRTRTRLQRIINSQIKNSRQHTLNSLCERFQMCYNDLL